MGRKSFISKKNATKFDLLYRPTTDPQAAPEREWVEASRKVGIGRPDVDRLAAEVHDKATSQHALGHPLAWLEEPEQDNFSEERRREIIALGFPDDGYDYLKHMRQGQAAPVAEATDGEEMAGRSDPSDSYEGPSVYIPASTFEAPPEDYKAIDASRLTVHQAATNDYDASLVAGGASAFARELNSVRRKHQEEIDEMERTIRQFEVLEDEYTDQGRGDLLEDFVLTATEVCPEPQPLPQRPSPSLPLVELAASCKEGSDWEEASAASSSDGYHPQPFASEAKSFASTYWRPERHDRNGNLSAIDERFEQLALGYDSDEIGDLEQLEGDPSTRGAATTDQFAGIMDEFLEVHATQDHSHEGGHAYHSAAAAARPLEDGESAEDAALAAAALARAKEHLHRMEEQEGEASGNQDDGADMLQMYAQPREEWDCESVLSTRSTLYNHPARLDAADARRKPRHQGIQLSHKTGLPISSERGEGSKLAAPGPSASSKAPMLTPLARKRDEDGQEKKQRKEAVKEAKRQARANKKEIKLMFKGEALRQQRQSAAPTQQTISLA